MGQQDRQTTSQLIAEYDRLQLEQPRPIIPRPLEPITPAMRETLRRRWPDGERLTTAWRLARDLDTLADLIAGRAVSADRLDQDALFQARRRGFVQLRAPIELVNVTEADA